MDERMKDYLDRMTPEQARTFGNDVLDIVSQIPRGRVTTYGYIATLAGWPSHARMVGRTLRYTPGAEKVPCHRVVNAVGRTAPGWAHQRTLLENEGVTFKANGHVDMGKHLWLAEMKTLAESAEIINNQLGDDKFKCEINQRISAISALSASKLI